MRSVRTKVLVGLVASTATLAVGCSSGSGLPTSGDTSSAAAAAQVEGDIAPASDLVSGVFDASTVHEIAVEFDEDDLDAMLEEYVATGDKEWIEATVEIDGITYAGAGIRLKGNSSLRGLAGDLGASDVAPEDLPWLIKLDKYVDGQHHDGVHDFVVRSNNSETSLNEAVALDLLEAAGLASQDAIAVAFSVNGSASTLRLVIEHPDDVWMADNFSADGALYKAESTGDYTWRGSDPDAYDEVFDQEAGKDNADLTPLIDFLDFLNNADDETFTAEIGDRLDVDAFATYLAMQDVIDNFDDIDGPGNNSYLYWDPESGRFTVVAWDHNLAFGDAGFGVGGEGGPGRAGGRPVFGDADLDSGPRGGEGFPERPDGVEPPDGVTGGGFGEPPAGFEPARGAGPGGGSNVLVDRMLADESFVELYETRLAELTATLIDSGLAQEIVATWTEVLRAGASDLVSADTIETEASRLSAGFSA